MISWQRILWCIAFYGFGAEPASSAIASFGSSKEGRKLPFTSFLCKEVSNSERESRITQRKWCLPVATSLFQYSRPTLDRIGRASQQIVTHLVLDSSTGNPATSRIFCLSGAACYLATKYAISRSEAAQRACYFWKRAGPIVVHYKVSQWWLNLSKAPIEKRNIVYKSLHDRYCGPSLELILSLKGLYVKVCTHLQRPL